MAPGKLKDDFVLTIDSSDDEAQLSGLEVEEDTDTEQPEEAIAARNGKKRKRQTDKTTLAADSAKGAKKRKAKHVPEQDGGESSDDEQDEVEGEKDGEKGARGWADREGHRDAAMNPDFEFQLEQDAGLEEFDAWEASAPQDLRKKGVDMDELIARKRARDGERIGNAREEDEKEDDESGLEEEVDSDDNEEDELQSDSDAASENGIGFGMGVPLGEGDESEEEDETGKEMDGDSESDVADDMDVDHTDLRSDDDERESDGEDAEEAARAKEFFAPEEQLPQANATSKEAGFQSMKLSRPILRGLTAVGFSLPTPIQAKTIPIALLGKDVVGGAVTGSGKTGAFVIPILERLLYRDRRTPTSRVAILMPTRELAVQCFNVATKLASYTDITFCQLVGGFSLREQENTLKKRPDVIIATPGRFIDHMRNSASFTIDTLEILVLDEADRMLEQGFADELNEILTTIPRSRQTMLFSATMTNTVDKLIRVGLNKPVRLMVDSRKQTVGTLTQEFVRLRQGREEKRLAYLLHLCANIFEQRCIIFFRQKKEAHRVRIVFGLLGFKVAELHGSMSQEQRISSVEAFRDGKVTHLLATDVASRGLDINGVEAVINYEAPQSHDIYLHRVGRTARAGRSGRACTLAAETDRKVVRAAVKAAKSQGAKIVSRVVDQAVADAWAAKVDALEPDVAELMREEKEERQMLAVEMQVRKGENLMAHEREIMARPKREWFQTEKEKMAAKKVGAKELSQGKGAVGGEGKSVATATKGKLSNKDKKKLDATRERKEGRMWKKGKGDAAAATVVVKGGKDKGSRGKLGSSRGEKQKKMKMKAKTKTKR